LKKSKNQLGKKKELQVTKEVRRKKKKSLAWKERLVLARKTIWVLGNAESKSQFQGKKSTPTENNLVEKSWLGSNQEGRRLKLVGNGSIESCQITMTDLKSGRSTRVFTKNKKEDFNHLKINTGVSNQENCT